MNHQKTKEQWAKRRQAIYDAVNVKGKTPREVANAYGITAQRVHKIIRKMEGR